MTWRSWPITGSRACRRSEGGRAAEDGEQKTDNGEVRTEKSHPQIPQTERCRGVQSASSAESAQSADSVVAVFIALSQRMRSILPGLCLLVSLFFPASAAFADPTTPKQAEELVRAWLRLDAQPLRAVMGRAVKELQTFKDGRHGAAYYVVYLEPSGFVIVPADDWVEPIVGFCPNGRYNPSPDNPLGALVSRDLAGRMAEVHRAAAEIRKNRAGRGASNRFLSARGKWELILKAAKTGRKGGLGNVSDERVSPLVQSRWDQDTVGGSNCYNYYTPDNYLCGCVATAMAQLMRLHQRPITGVGTPSFTITVDGVNENRSLRGGDGLGDPYAWAAMVLVPDGSITETQRQAIGALTHDAGVSVNMKYTSASSSTNTLKAATGLVNTFGYGNAVQGYNSGDNIGAGLNGMINPNLDAGCPVILGVRRSGGGHALLCDGYGYNVATLYHHLNMGWGGDDDAWYNLPNIESSPAYNSVTKCVYNARKDGPESNAAEDKCGRSYRAAANYSCKRVRTITAPGNHAF